MLRGVVALCYGVDNKVPKLIAWRRGNIQIGGCKMGNCVEKVKNHWSMVTDEMSKFYATPYQSNANY